MLLEAKVTDEDTALVHQILGRRDFKLHAWSTIFEAPPPNLASFPKSPAVSQKAEVMAVVKIKPPGSWVVRGFILLVPFHQWLSRTTLLISNVCYPHAHAPIPLARMPCSMRAMRSFFLQIFGLGFYVHP